jgi:RNA polymerase sigma-70 factor (ECF subfamily)
MADGSLGDVVRHLRKLSDPVPLEQVPDVSLVQRFVTAGDEPAFGEMLRRHGPVVLRICREVLRHEQDAEDAFQATFLVLAKKAGTLRRGEALAGWLYRVACRVALEARRRDHARQGREHTAARTTPAAASPPALDDTLALVHEAVALLPARERAAVVLCYLEGRSNPDAARELGWPVGSVKTRLTRAREKLRRWLLRKGVPLTPALLAPPAVELPPLDSLPGAACAFARGQVVPGLSPSVLTLTRGVLRTMWLTRVRTVAGLLLAVCLLGAGVSAYAFRPLPPSPGPSPLLPLARAPKPERKTPPALIDSDHLALPIAARGRVVFSPDGKHVVYQAGGKLYLAGTAALVKAGKAGVKPTLLDTVHAGDVFPEALFVPGQSLRIVARTTGGLKAFAIEAKGVRGTTLVRSDARPVSVDPNGHWLFVAMKGEVAVVPLEGKRQPRWKLARARFGAWGDDNLSVVVVKDGSHDVLSVELRTGKTTTLVSGAAIRKQCGVDLERVEVRAATGKGAARRLFLMAWQKAQPGPFAGTVVYEVPAGAKKRGRSPGSAEPGAEPPSWALLHAGGKLTTLSANWKARFLDEVLVLPSRTLHRFLRAQMAQKGSGQDGHTPDVWLGMIDDRGEIAEKTLAKSPFPDTMRDLHWQVLDVKDAASKALVLVTCNVTLHKTLNDPNDLADLATSYGRLGATMQGNTAVLKFQAWSLWSFDAVRGEMKQLTKLYAEKFDELKKTTVGLEGKLGTLGPFLLGEHVAYSRAAGVVALSLNRQTVFTLDREMLAPVVLIRAPRW